MSLTATSRSIRGTLRQEIVIDDKHRLITDEPESVGGDGSGPVPHELLPAALASCISTTLVMYARTKDWDIGDVIVEVEYDNHSTPRKFEIAVRISGDLSDAQLDRLEKVAAACPVRRSIEAGIEFHERIARDENTRQLVGLYAATASRSSGAASGRGQSAPTTLKFWLTKMWCGQLTPMLWTSYLPLLSFTTRSTMPPG